MTHILDLHDTGHFRRLSVEFAGVVLWPIRRGFHPLGQGLAQAKVGSGKGWGAFHRALPALGQMAGKSGSGAGGAFDRDPAAMQLYQGLDQRRTQAGPRPFLAAEAVEDAGLDVERDTPSGVGDFQADLAERAPRRQGHAATRRSLAQRVVDQMIDHAGEVAPIGQDDARIITDDQVQGDATLGRAGHPAQRRQGQQGGVVGVGQLEGHLPGVDLGEGQNVLHRPGEIGGRRPHRRHPGARPFRQGLIGAFQQLGIAEDRRQRGAQLVGGAADEVPLQPLGGVQRRLAVGQRAFQPAGVGDIDETHQGRTVRQRPRLPGHAPPVGDHDLAQSHAPDSGVEIGDPALQRAPESQIVQPRHTALDNVVEGRRRRQIGRGYRPERLERLIVQLQPPIGAEHRHRVGKLVQRGFLHLDQLVKLAPQPQFRGDIGEHQNETPGWMWQAEDAQGAVSGHAPDRLRSRGQAFVAHQLRRLESPIVGRFRQPAVLAQPIQQGAMTGSFGQPGRLKAPEFGEGAIVIGQSPIGPEQRHGVGRGAEDQGLGLGLPDKGRLGGRSRRSGWGGGVRLDRQSDHGQGSRRAAAEADGASGTRHGEIAGRAGFTQRPQSGAGGRVEPG